MLKNWIVFHVIINSRVHRLCQTADIFLYISFNEDYCKACRYMFFPSFSSHLVAVNTHQTNVITFYFLTYSNGKLKVNEVVKAACVLGAICKELWERCVYQPTLAICRHTCWTSKVHKDTSFWTMSILAFSVLVACLSSLCSEVASELSSKLSKCQFLHLTNEVSIMANDWIIFSRLTTSAGYLNILLGLFLWSVLSVTCYYYYCQWKISMH